MTPIRCLLWDFGDTLCDETFIWSSGPEWMEVYQTFDDGGLGAAWNLGEIDTRGFASELAKRMGWSVDAIVAHMGERCHHIEFFPETYAFFQARHLPQAIVKVNPDLFSERIVPICQFETCCGAIVTSWEEGTTDKAVLCQLAIERMGLSCKNSEALLIDNKQANLEDWAGRQGAGYLYSTDAQFARDVSDGFDALAGAGIRPGAAPQTSR